METSGGSRGSVTGAEERLRVSFAPLLPSFVFSAVWSGWRASRRLAGVVRWLVKTLIVAVVLGVVSVMLYGVLVYVLVPFRLHFAVPVDLVFVPRVDGTAANATRWAEGRAPLPTMLTRRLLRRSRWSSRCASVDAADCRCRETGQLRMELELVLPESRANEETGMVTLEMELWQVCGTTGAVSNAADDAVADARLLYRTRRSARPLIYQSGVSTAVRRAFSLPEALWRSVNAMWRTRGNAKRASRFVRQVRCLLLAPCASVRMELPERGGSRPELLAMKSPWRWRRFSAREALEMSRLLAHFLVWRPVVAATSTLVRLPLSLTRLLVSLVPFGVGEWANDRYLLRKPVCMVEARLHLLPGGGAGRTPTLPLELEDQGATLVMEWLLGGYRHVMRHHALVAACIGTSAIFGALATLAMIAWVLHGNATTYGNGTEVKHSVEARRLDTGTTSGPLPAEEMLRSPRPNGRSRDRPSGLRRRMRHHEIAGEET